MRNLGVMILATGALLPLAWVAIEGVLWWARRTRWGEEVAGVVEPYTLPLAVFLALVVAGVLVTVFS